MGSYLMHSTQLQEINITTGELVERVILHANKHRYGEHGQSELALLTIFEN